MRENDRYRVNKPDVILEDFGDEVVIVNLAIGNYYSVDAVAAAIWAMVQQGATPAEICARLSAEYDSPAESIEQAVTEFIRNLVSESLIVPDAEAPRPRISDIPASQPRKPFSSPVLHKYTDMQELLLIDPIHEVDETGWPNIPDTVSGAGSEPNK